MFRCGNLFYSKIIVKEVFLLFIELWDIFSIEIINLSGNSCQETLEIP